MLLLAAPDLPRPPAEAVIDSDYVVYRLEDAGKTLMSMRVPGTWPAGFRSCLPEFVRDAGESYGWTEAELRPRPPMARAVTRMDEALAWLQLIPDDRRDCRRVVAMRSLVNPLNERHTFSWPRLGEILHADPRELRRQHARGIAIIVRRLGWRE